MALESKDQERVDRISELPNPVLSRILSLLETREAVHTTLLSKRWENLWTSLSNLEFRGTCIYFPKNIERVCDRFMTFVDRVVSSHDLTDIQKFILVVHFDGYREHEYFPRIHSWIVTAARHNVVEVELTLFNNKETFQFPQSLFTSKTLKVLKVQSDCITYEPPTSGCFPSLKVLNVTVGCPDHSAENLSSCCPVLEDLTIDECHAIDVLDINISAPELKDLLIHLELPVPVGGSRKKFYINAPKLESLDLFHEISSSDFVFENAKSLVKAKIWCDNDPDEYPDRVNALLASISSVRGLCLSIPSFFKDSNLPAFENLIHLELAVCDHDYWELLIQVLKTSSTLKHFVFRNQAIMYDEEMYDEEHEIEWNSGNQLDVVPICVSSHLKCITMYQFKGQRDEMKVAEYLLKNGLVLDMMTIYTERPRTSIDRRGCLYSIEKLYEKFSLFEKGSKICQVQITCKDNPRCYFLDYDL